MSDPEQTVLYEQFVAARERAIELTDRYNAVGMDDLSRAKLWEYVVRQTETTRLLLERWLRTGKLTDQTHKPATLSNAVVARRNSIQAALASPWMREVTLTPSEMRRTGLEQDCRPPAATRPQAVTTGTAMALADSARTRTTRRFDDEQRLL